MKANDFDTRFTVGDQKLSDEQQMNAKLSLMKLRGFGMTVCKFCGKVVPVDFHKCFLGAGLNEFTGTIDERLL